jgi:uncharacterized protein
MKRTITLLLALLLSFSQSALAAETPPLTFNGTLGTSDATQFGLTTADGSKSGWIKLGGSFDGFTLKSYDAPSETLSLERAGQLYSLNLSSGKFTGDATTAADTKVTNSAAQAAIYDTLFSKFTEGLLESQQRSAAKITERLAQKFGEKISDEDLTAHRNRLAAVMREGMNPEQMKKDMAQVFPQVFTKEQLAAATSSDTSLADKTMKAKKTELQRRLMELMMPRVINAQLKISELNDEFLEQQKAKAQTGTQAAL